MSSFVLLNKFILIDVCYECSFHAAVSYSISSFIKMYIDSTLFQSAVDVLMRVGDV